MKYILSLFLSLFMILPASARFSIRGVEAFHEAKGAEDIRIFYLKSLSGAYAEYETTAVSVRFFKYSVSGRTEVPASDISQNGNTYTIYNLEDSYGYVSQEDGGSDLLTMWIIDYSRHLPVLKSITVVPVEVDNGDCEDREEKLLIDKEESSLTYYLPDRQTPYILPNRKYKVQYEDIEWKDGKFADIVRGNPDYADIGDETNMPSPLKNTRFVLKGDEIADILGLGQEIASDEFEAVKVDPHIIAKEIKENLEEEGEETEEGIGTSAPVTVNFEGISNEPATLYYTWYIYKGSESEDNVKATFFNEKNITYTFTEAGKYIVKLEAASSNSACVMFSEGIEINISESELDVPNYFSPGGDSSEGNNEFKVKHKSLIKFKCSIFNRWGNKVFEFDDPDKGWDGKYKGKLVNPGVYFYVIEATGSDGIKYKKGGDINILISK